MASPLDRPPVEFTEEWFALPLLAPVRLIGAFQDPLEHFMHCPPHDEECQCPHCRDARRMCRSCHRKYDESHNNFSGGRNGDMP